MTASRYLGGPIMRKSMRKLLFIFSALILAATAFAGSNDKNPEIKYVTQILEPTGGKILKPESWYYEERHRAIESMAWVISKEDPKDGYKVGLSIQFMLGIQKHAGKTPKEFILKTIEDRRKAGSVLSQCVPEAAGLFTRTCLETEETRVVKGAPTKFHVRYAFFWGNAVDMVGITMAGAPLDEWAENAEIFDRMSDIELIDPKRFAK